MARRKIELEQIDFEDVESGNRQKYLNILTDINNANNNDILTKNCLNIDDIENIDNILDIDDSSDAIFKPLPFETNINNIKMSSVVSLGESNKIAYSDHTHPSEVNRTKTSISVKNTSTQTINNDEYVLVTFPTENYDVNSEFSNNTFTAKTAQTVLVSSYIEYETGLLGATYSITILIYKNNSEIFRSTATTTASTNGIPGIHICFPVKVDINDTINIYTYQNYSSSKDLIGKQVLTIEQIF